MDELRLGIWVVVKLNKTDGRKNEVKEEKADDKKDYDVSAGQLGQIHIIVETTDGTPEHLKISFGGSCDF